MIDSSCNCNQCQNRCYEAKQSNIAVCATCKDDINMDRDNFDSAKNLVGLWEYYHADCIKPLDVVQ